MSYFIHCELGVIVNDVKSKLLTDFAININKKYSQMGQIITIGLPDYKRATDFRWDKVDSENYKWNQRQLNK